MSRTESSKFKIAGATNRIQQVKNACKFEFFSCFYWTCLARRVQFLSRFHSSPISTLQSIRTPHKHFSFDFFSSFFFSLSAQFPPIHRHQVSLWMRMNVIDIIQIDEDANKHFNQKWIRWNAPGNHKFALKSSPLFVPSHMLLSLTVFPLIVHDELLNREWLFRVRKQLSHLRPLVCVHVSLFVNSYS